MVQGCQQLFISTCACSSYLLYISSYLITLLRYPHRTSGCTHILEHTFFQHGYRTNYLHCYNASLDRLRRGGLSGFNIQNRKCRRGPALTAAAAAAATRVPNGTVSVPLPRTPNENILSKTCSRLFKRSVGGNYCGTYVSR